MNVNDYTGGLLIVPNEGQKKYLQGSGINMPIIRANKNITLAIDAKNVNVTRLHFYSGNVDVIKVTLYRSYDSKFFRPMEYITEVSKLSTTFAVFAKTNRDF